MKIHRRFFIKKIIKLYIFLLLPFKLKSLTTIQDCELTTSDIQGPYYSEDSPNVSILSPPEIITDLLYITGTVYANDCTTPIPNAIVDVWHANKGEYDKKENVYLNSGYEENMYRAKINTDENGNYAYQTILPGKYLNGSYYRPSHIHYKSSYLNKNELTTQIYFQGDSTINIDPWASIPEAENRIITTTIDEENNLHGVFDIYLNVPPESIENIQISEKRMIHSIYPNPITNNTVIYLNNNIRYISLDICDVNGNIIANAKNISHNKINLYSLLNKNTARGVYVLRVLKKNIPIDSKRFIIN